MTNEIHVFEIAGLGKAPFKFVGLVNTSIGANKEGLVRRTDKDGVDWLTKPGGSCDFCGRYIKYFCWIVSSDGKKFKVGTECVKKTGDLGLKKVVDAALTKYRREERWKKERKRIEEGKALFSKNEIKTILASRPHPQKWLAEKGLTQLDWVNWMMKNAGNKGKLEACKLIKSIS